MKLGILVGLGPSYIVLDGDPSPPKGAQPPIFGPCLLWPDSWMDQDIINLGTEVVLGSDHIVLLGDPAPPT